MILMFGCEEARWGGGGTPKYEEEGCCDIGIDGRGGARPGPLGW